MPYDTVTLKMVECGCNAIRFKILEILHYGSAKRMEELQNSVDLTSSRNIRKHVAVLRSNDLVIKDGLLYRISFLGISVLFGLKRLCK